ncbi:MAG: DUF86 domain-containing protein [Gammaproteobacteria bacterium]|nr:DUF86 domain-containing protein [Gammaproteobacteria bacterium]
MKASAEERDIKELEFIADSIRRVRTWGATGRESLNDEVLGEAIDSRMRKIAESTQRLSASLTSSEPNIPWVQISGFRNVMTHDYHEIDRDRLWKVIAQDLPALGEAVERMLVRTKDKLQTTTRKNDLSR